MRLLILRLFGLVDLVQEDMYGIKYFEYNDRYNRWLGTK